MQDQDNILPVQMKTCLGCGIEKPVTEFHARPVAKDKLRPRCKVCDTEQMRKWYVRNKQRYSDALLPPEKRCSVCGQVKHRDKFSKSRSSKDGLDYLCRDCKSIHNRKHTKLSVKDANLWALYRIRRNDFDRLLQDQGNRCAICRGELRKPLVDHDHLTGKTRGILCDYCNVMLAGIEREGFLQSALEYLRKHGSRIPVEAKAKDGGATPLMFHPDGSARSIHNLASRKR